MKRLSVAGKGPPSRKRFHDAGGFEKGQRVFQAEEDTTVVVCPLSKFGAEAGESDQQ